MSMLIALLLVQAAPATPPPATVAQAEAEAEAPDPARLAAARALVDVLMPQATRDAMIVSMVQPIMANMQQMILSDTTFGKMIGNDADLRATFERFLQRQNATTLETMRAGLPGMFEAMTRAYARRFTVQQMADAQAFFSTSSGQAYIRGSMTVMSDPDIQAWQRSLMQKSMSEMPTRVAELMTELRAAGEKK
ncbi:DUF2059 domain-containing protein [uncultured Sphingomonas sp.]|uniref:DUF2059 domain-containing protein n=1 Tax=uncultured Sphingomonas sp. TaxID=158754 RepID=UPI00374A3D8F